ncbi:MAG: acetyl-CoA carboxylase biotin carboxyl carrier protein subunit, partial [Desulfobacterales bacterium]|nr:acetyl-CoA carboxylase biotin carboxyl carrier protein subunit [Desulfobacterales bacterium]
GKMSQTPVSTSLPAPGSASIVAPIPGVILDIAVQVGDKVEAGQTVVIIEAMKMENNLVSSTDGIVREIRVQKGAKVKTGDLIMIIG